MKYQDTPVIEFLRVWTAEPAADDHAGVQLQMEANRKTAEMHGLAVIRTVKLVDVSGTLLAYAPEVVEMLSDLRSGKARGIVCADIDRLMRPADFGTLAVLQDLREAHALIYLPDQVVDLDTQSHLLLGVQSEIVCNELARIKTKRLFLFDGYLRCGVCGGIVCTSPSGEQAAAKDHYLCRRHVSRFGNERKEPCSLPHLRRDMVESTLERFITEQLSNPDYIMEAFKVLACQDRDTVIREISTIEKEIAGMEDEKMRLLDLFLEDVLTGDEFKANAPVIQGVIDRLTIRLTNLSESSTAVSLEQFSEMVARMAEACSEFPFWTDREKREFLNLYKPQFYLTKDGVSQFRLFTDDLVCNDPAYAYAT